MAAEFDVLKEIPGYKAILKSVLKSQIQMLMEQLSDQTGEESIILTASVHDGSLSHLGSNTGKGFLEGRDEIKAQFLGYCLKSQHRKESMEAESQQYSRSRTLMPPARRQRPRIRPAPYSISSPGSSTSVTSSPSFPLSSQHAINSMKQSNNINMTLKSETTDAADNFLDSVTSEGDAEFPGTDDSCLANQAVNPNESFDSSQSSSQDDVGDSAQTVKMEPQPDNNDIEVTGVEMGDNSLSSSDNWGQSYSSSGQDGNQADQNSFSGTLLARAQQTTSDGYEYVDPSHPYLTPRFSCTICGKDFLFQSYLNRHMVIHTKNKPYKCDYCESRFTQMGSKNSHMKKIHNVVTLD